MDHRDCGAYKVILGPQRAKSQATETLAHASRLRRLREQIKAKQPALEVELLLMNLEGKVEAAA